MKISREVKTAILVISGILLMVFLFNYLKGINILDSNDKYYTVFDYNALDASAPVTINGNKVGKISSIEYITETGKTKVNITVNTDLKFSADSKIRMYETGLMGGNGLAIIPGQSEQFAKNGDFLESEVEPGLIRTLTNNFSGISADLGSTLQSADTLLVNLNRLVVDDSQDGLKRTIAELNTTISSFNKLSNNLNSLISKNDSELTSAIKNFNTITADMAVLTNDLKEAKLSESIAKLETTLDNVNSLMANVKNGQGSLGKLMTNDELYNNLEGASKELEELLKDIKLHPKRYFRILSKKEIPYENQ